MNEGARELMVITSTSLFLSIPRELRDKIYSHLFVRLGFGIITNGVNPAQASIVPLPLTDAWSGRDNNGIKPFTCSSQLLRCCKQIYTEGSMILYSYNTFYFDLKQASLDARGFFASLSPENRCRIRKVAVVQEAIDHIPESRQPPVAHCDLPRHELYDYMAEHMEVRDLTVAIGFDCGMDCARPCVHIEDRVRRLASIRSLRHLRLQRNGCSVSLLTDSFRDVEEILRRLLSSSTLTIRPVEASVGPFGSLLISLSRCLDMTFKDSSP